MRDPRKDILVRKQTHITIKPKDEEADPFADLRDEIETQKPAKTGTCMTPSRLLKQAPHNRNKTEGSLDTPEQANQQAEQALFFAKGEDICCTSPTISLERAMPAKVAPNQIGGVSHTFLASGTRTLI